jgi:hypothetical protein
VKLSEEEYRQGLVWLDCPGILVNVASTDTPEDPDSWTAGIVVRSGEIVPVPAAARRAMRVLLERSDRSFPEGWTVRWEFSVGSHVQTLILDDVDGGCNATLAFVPVPAWTRPS